MMSHWLLCLRVQVDYSRIAFALWDYPVIIVSSLEGFMVPLIFGRLFRIDGILALDVRTQNESSVLASWTLMISVFPV